MLKTHKPPMGERLGGAEMRQGRGTGRGDKEAETGGALHFDDLR